MAKGTCCNRNKRSGGSADPKPAQFWKTINLITILNISEIYDATMVQTFSRNLLNRQSYQTILSRGDAGFQIDGDRDYNITTTDSFTFLNPFNINEGITNGEKRNHIYEPQTQTLYKVVSWERTIDNLETLVYCIKLKIQ